MTSIPKHQILLQTKANFTARGCNMDNKGKAKSLTVSDKISILVHAYAHIATCVELAPWSILSMPTQNSIVKN